MDHFLYRDGSLWAEDVPLEEVAAAVGTPAYVYSSATRLRHLALFEEALRSLPHLVCFAVKALSNVAVLKLLGDEGAGMDVVSEGEYRRAVAAGVPGDRLGFSGAGKARGGRRTPRVGRGARGRRPGGPWSARVSPAARPPRASPATASSSRAWASRGARCAPRFWAAC